jgi:hypothetical protein
MVSRFVLIVACFSVLFSSYAFGAVQVGIEVKGGNLKIADDGSGVAFPDGTVQKTAATPGASSVIGNSVQVDQTSVGAGVTADVATLNLSMVGNRTLLVLPTVSGLTWGAAPAEYGGKNHSLHINVQWKILAGPNRVVIGSFQQNAEQNIIQLQGGGFPTTVGNNAITLQAVNSSYWSLDDSPYGTTPVGSNNFFVTLSAMEL